MDIKQKEIATKHNVTEATVSYLLSGKRYTKNIKLAIDLAKLKGTRAIEYINPSFRKIYEKAYPRLKAVKA
jgi:DNA-binding XRE family transcriptional regulator